MKFVRRVKVPAFAGMTEKQEEVVRRVKVPAFAGMTEEGTIVGRVNIVLSKLHDARVNFKEAEVPKTIPEKTA
jgi:hypothetical protein